MPKLALVLLFLPLGAQAQIRAGCTPMSLSNLMAESLSVAGLWEYSCGAQNIGTTVATLSVVGFKLDFIELQQVDQGDVIDILTQRQKRTKSATVALIAEAIGVGALAITGAPVVLTANEVRGIAIATYGATKLGQYFTSKIPPLTNAVAGLLTQDQILQPGASFQWKLYASNQVTPPVQPLSSKPRLAPHATPPVRILTNVQAPRAALDTGIKATATAAPCHLTPPTCTGTDPSVCAKVLAQVASLCDMNMTLHPPVDESRASTSTADPISWISHNDLYGIAPTA